MIITPTTGNVWLRLKEFERVMKKLVIAWDADQDLEFDEALVDARNLIGFKLSKDE